MEPDITSLLEQQLRDIQTPAEIGWWPLAPGWWILLVLGLALLWVISYQIRRYIKSNKYRKSARSELDQLLSDWHLSEDTPTFLAGCNALLRRIILSFGHHGFKASALGQQWSETLASLTPTTLPPEVEQALTVECYRRQPNVDVEQLHSHLVQWLKTHRRPTCG